MTLSLAMSMGLTSVQSPPATAPADDTTPDAFDFTPVTGADRSTLYVSNIVTIAGINAAAAVAVTGGEYRKNGGAWTTSAGTVVAGDTLQVRGTSSASYTADVNVTLTVGGVADTYTITTKADPVAVSAIQTLTIMDATPLDATGDYGDATARTGVNGNGWVARVTVPYDPGQTFDPTKIVLTIQDPRNDGSGAVTGTHTIRGTEVLRRQYNAQANKQLSNNGVTLTVDFALSGLVYEGSTPTAASAEAGFYGSSAAGSISTIANNSTLPFYRALGAWLNMQHERCGAGGMYVELAAASWSGVARVEFYAKDATGNVSAVQTASAPHLSTLQTQGNIAEVWSATIPVTNLNQGELCQAFARVYSRLGDAVLDLELDGVAWPTANPQTPLRFLNDKNGTYGGAIAFWRAGAGGTGVVSRDEATARANPFATLALATAALAAFNNANSTPAHNDHSGSTIYAMDDGASGAVVHTIPASITTPAGHCWTDIKPDPLATGAVSISMTATRAIPDLMRFFVDINHTAGNGFDAGAATNNKRIAFGGGVINSTGGASLAYRNGLIYLANVTINATDDLAMLSGASATRNQTALALGVIAENATGDGRSLAFAMIGCRTKRFALQEQNPATITSWDSQDGRFIYNNWFRDVRSAGQMNAVANHREYVVGMALIQNLFETSGSGQTGLRLGGDNTVQPFDNVLAYHNTFVGGRLNVAYADAAGAVGILKRLRLFGNLGNDTLNIKTDTFATTTTARGRVGNWRTRYHVDDLANVWASGSALGTSLQPDGSSWLGECADPSNRLNVGIANIHFADDQSQPIGTGPLGGIYSLTGGSNAAYDAVPAGTAMLAYDIAGNARRNNGTGAAGCYERAA